MSGLQVSEVMEALDSLEVVKIEGSTLNLVRKQVNEIVVVLDVSQHEPFEPNQVDAASELFHLPREIGQELGLLNQLALGLGLRESEKGVLAGVVALIDLIHEAAPVLLAHFLDELVLLEVLEHLHPHVVNKPGQKLSLVSNVHGLLELVELAL